jgi:thiamine biosynthesis protein ThiS
MNLRVNGEPREVSEGATLLSLVESLGLNPGRIACEVNMDIVKRADYAARRLKDGDTVEIVQMIGGG